MTRGRNATALEGLPQVRIETTRDGAQRHELDATAAANSCLSIAIKDGRFFWAGRDGRPLTVITTEDYTYLSSTEPGAYGSVTLWGELRIVLEK